MADKNKIREEVQHLSEQLETGIVELYESDKYKDYLDCLAKFPKYSMRNIMLIYRQMPGASLVASFGKWKKDFERSVSKGQKGIRIFAPMPYAIKEQTEKVDSATGAPLIDENGKISYEETEKELILFKPISVFDVSQTQGKPIPELSEDLIGDVLRYEALLKAVKAVSPFPISFNELPTGVDGVCNYNEQEITIQSGMSERQTISTIIHEITHATLHNANMETEQAILQNERTSTTKERSTKEIEAESIAYVVCKYFGIETKENSFGYVASWSDGKELSELKNSLTTIRNHASELIAGIDHVFKDICKEKATVLLPDEKPKKYDLGYGHLGNGVTVWNRLEEKNGDYVTLAHIDTDRAVTFHVEDLPKELREQIEKEAQTMEMTVSQTQRDSVFSSPAKEKHSEVLEHKEVEPSQPIQTRFKDSDLMEELISETTEGYLPDPKISFSERDLYGYTWNEMLPLLKEKALELFDEEQCVYLLYPDGGEAVVFDREEIEEHSGIYGIEKTEWNNFSLSTEQDIRPTVGELETSVRAGESISLLDVAKAIKKETVVHSSLEKPSILEALKKNKEAIAQKNTPSLDKETEKTL